MKTYWGSGGIAPRILDLGTRWRWVVSFTPRPLYHQGKSPWYPLDRRLGRPQSRSGGGGEEKIPSLRRESNLRTLIVQPVAQRYTDWAITALFSNVSWISAATVSCILPLNCCSDFTFENAICPLRSYKKGNLIDWLMWGERGGQEFDSLLSIHRV
jgi:hypothetical protein